MSEPTVSVILTTKNRPATAAHVVRTILKWPDDDVELIVQDCGDERLERELEKSPDPRLRYQRTAPVSMTQNWNNAFERTRGEYVIIIGDDDGVSSRIVAAARWARAQQIDALIYSWSSFHWPDFPDAKLAGRLLVPNANGAVEEIDFQTELERQSHTWGGNISRLPHAYHGLVRRELLTSIKKKVGQTFSSSSPDFYAAFALATQTSTLRRIEYPLSMMGHCGESNTARAKQRSQLSAKAKRAQRHPHFTEFGSVALPSALPDVEIVQVHLAESMLHALHDCGRADLERNVDLANIYAAAALHSLTETPALLRAFQRGLRQYDRSSFGNWLRLASCFTGRAALQLLRAAMPPSSERLAHHFVLQAHTIEEALDLQNTTLSGVPLPF